MAKLARPAGEIKRWTIRRANASLAAMTLLRLASLLLCLAILGGCACAPGTATARKTPTVEQTFGAGV
ncbi:MAG: hypothetical protein JNJ53_04455 [Rhizobiales bacterium]|nr:hypothetical protein [Hyphomicrobiales bacterium]